MCPPSAIPLPETAAGLDGEQQQALLLLARRAVDARTRHGTDTEVPRELLARHPRLADPGASFVTLRIGEDLRGCIGSLLAVEPLARDVVRNAVNAATRDPRFSPVGVEELDRIRISVSVLEEPRPLELFGPELVRHLAVARPGVILEYRGRRSTFLPEVWEDLSDPEDFLGHLCLKQGSPVTAWEDPAIRVRVYGSQHFGEPER